MTGLDTCTHGDAAAVVFDMQAHEGCPFCMARAALDESKAWADRFGATIKDQPTQMDMIREVGVLLDIVREGLGPSRPIDIGARIDQGT